jgi:hypothetical protein
MGLDELHLRVLAASSADLKEKANAKKGAIHTIHVIHGRSPSESSSEADAKRPSLGARRM